MRLTRPYIPLGVKLEVAARQLLERGLTSHLVTMAVSSWGHDRKLTWMLRQLFGDEPVHLDHDPPLWQRERKPDGTYEPDANDPKYLIWRTKEEHRLKTYVRGDGAQLSDAGQRRKMLRRLRPKRRYNWPSRKLVSRNDLRRRP